MSKRYFTRVRILCVFLLLAVAAASSVWSQTPLDKLEQQIRQRVENESQPPQPGIAAPTTAAEQKPTASAENSEPGYIGFVADDRQDRGRGVRVLDVTADGPADKSGFKKSDLITSVAGVRTRQLTEMSDVLSLYAAGESVEFDILRDNKPQKIKVTLGRRPAPKAASDANAETIPTPQGETNKDADIPPALSSPRSPASANLPTIEQLLKRIEQLERRVTELEKKLEEKK